jgi:hypothetical protein
MDIGGLPTLSVESLLALAASSDLFALTILAIYVVLVYWMRSLVMDSKKDLSKHDSEKQKN